MEGIFNLTRLAKSKGYLIFVITNQAGIGRGYYSESDFEILTNWMREEFKSEGVTIDKVYYSPYHPIYGLGAYRKDHISRKPNPGMLQTARLEFDLDLKSSVLIGDKLTDIQAGLCAGVGKNIYLGSNVISGACDARDYLSITSLSDANEHL